MQMSFKRFNVRRFFGSPDDCLVEASEQRRALRVLLLRSKWLDSPNQ